MTRLMTQIGISRQMSPRDRPSPSSTPQQMMAVPPLHRKPRRPASSAESARAAD